MILYPIYACVFGGICGLIYGVCKYKAEHPKRKRKNSGAHDGHYVKDLQQLTASCILKKARERGMLIGLSATYLTQIVAMSGVLANTFVGKIKMAKQIDALRGEIILSGVDDIDLDYILSEASKALTKKS